MKRNTTHYKLKRTFNKVFICFFVAINICIHYNVSSQPIIHNNTTSLVTGTWFNNGTLTDVATNSPCEGVSHYKFAYTSVGWWAGFGLNMNSWATTPGIKYDFSPYLSLRITYRGLSTGHELRARLVNRYATPTNSQDVLVGPTISICTTVDIPITSFTNGVAFDLTSVTEISLFIGNSQTGSGEVFIDDIQLVPASCNLLVNNIQNNGAGSLANALACAQENDVITFSSSLMGQTLQLDNTPIQVSKNITFKNEGAGEVTISSAPGLSIFSISENKELNLENINLIGRGKKVFDNLGVVKLKNLDITMKADTAFQNQGQVFIDGSVNVRWQNFDTELLDKIVVDQFGYRNNAKKIAIIRTPQIGYDAGSAYTPGTAYALIDKSNLQEVYTGTITAWNNGATETASGDKVWWFDFSTVTSPGTYYVLDKSTGAKSFDFKIGNDVYKEVLKATFKTFYYQRAGFNKTSQYAGAPWADGPSHLQDTVSRDFLDKDNLSKIKNLSGGWYDAGDYNKYTAWHSSYIITLLQMYRENPTVWTDDFGIPESGNGIPDILDEVNFGLQWLYKMQQSDGSCLSVLGVTTASPPSASIGTSYYGLASTFATLRTAEAMAYSAYIFNTVPALSNQVANLITKAEQAWTWANANPTVLFPNNVASNNTQGLAAGNQETNDIGRATAKLGASLYLYMATNTASYKTYFESNYNQMPLIAWTNYISQYYFEQQDILLEYCKLSNANTTIVSSIKSTTNTAMKNTGDFANIVLNNGSAYRAYIKDYNWGSNQYKSIYGNFFTLAEYHNIDAPNNTIYKQAAESYLHYIHGANPFNRSYLTNMTDLGADKQISQFYHSWFADQSAWDTNPAPGFLAGGPNKFYTIDDCCPLNCGGSNAVCNSESLSPPIGQPGMKSYKDFNTSWPLNSWQVTENSNGYQVAYLRLLSKFVE